MCSNLAILIMSVIATRHVAQSTFTTQPMSVRQAKGLEAVFECLYPGAIAHAWAVDGIFLSEDNPPPGVVGIGTTSLTIPAIPEYNNTVIQCRAFTSSGMFDSENATLTVYGVKTTNVSNAKDAISLSWTDHNFTSTITYCVDVVQTFGTTEHVSSECGLTETQYTFSSPGHGPCDRFNFTVTPTDGTHNGTSSQPLSAVFAKPAAPQAVDIKCEHDQEADQSICQLSGSNDSSLEGVCQFMLTFTNIDDEILGPVHQTQMIEGNGARPDVFPVRIPCNRNFTVETNILVQGVTTRLPYQDLTTHDIKRAEVMDSSDDLITSCTFVSNTKATGYLAIVSRNNCENGMEDAIFFTDYTTEDEPHTLHGVGQGVYNVAFFDLEGNGLPSYSRSSNAPYIGAASIREVTVSDGNPSNPEEFTGSADDLGDASIVVDGNNICITCPTECLALVYSCNNVDVTVSVMVTGGPWCINLTDGYHSTALFGMANQTNQQGPLHRHPGMQKSFNIGVDPTSSAPTQSVINTFFICVCLVFTFATWLL